MPFPWHTVSKPMNYLAHLALAGPEPALRLGGFLGDWLKGPLAGHAGQWPAAVLQGVWLHRQIDGWVDRQAEVRSAMALLGADYRRVAGPVVDICFDHCLARDFARWHGQSLARFSAGVFEDLLPAQDRMPAPARAFLLRARQQRLFEAYANEDTLVGVLGSLRRRLRRPDLLLGIEAVVLAERAGLQSLFDDFYPRLRCEAGRLRALALHQQVVEK